MKQDAARQISRAANMIRRRMSGFKTMEGLTFSQTRVLYFILRNSQEVYQRDIEEEYMLRPPTATALLKSMEEAGLIERKPSKEDGRKKRIIPTQEALALVDEAEREILALEECITEDISPEELELFFRITDRMISNLQKLTIRE